MIKEYLAIIVDGAWSALLSLGSAYRINKYIKNLHKDKKSWWDLATAIFWLYLLFK